MLCNKYRLLILPLFVAICEIWLPGLTYSVYLVLSLKPGATGTDPELSQLEVKRAELERELNNMKAAIDRRKSILVQIPDVIRQKK